jgi:DNA-binding transcriptional LysR family regulator
MAGLRLEQLRVKQMKFVSLLASLGSLAATAEHLSMTPSAASMMLKEIEGIFDAKLFVRQGRGMALTAQGRALLPRCQTVLGEIGAMGASLTGGTAPLLRIGAFPHTTTTVLPQIVQELISEPAAWRLQILSDSSERLLQQLVAGEIDLLLGQLPRQAASAQSMAGLAQRVLYQSQLSIVASRNHPLCRARQISVAELLAWPWVLPGVQSTTRVALEDAFLRLGLAPPLPVVESPSFFFSLSLVAETQLLTCCAHSAAIMSNHKTAVLPVKFEISPNPVALVWRENSAEAARAIERLKDLQLMPH